MKFSVILFALLLTISCETSHSNERSDDVDSVKVDSVDARSYIEVDEKKKSVNKS